MSARRKAGGIVRIGKELTTLPHNAMAKEGTSVATLP